MSIQRACRTGPAQEMVHYRISQNMPPRYESTSIVYSTRFPARLDLFATRASSKNVDSHPWPATNRSLGQHLLEQAIGIHRSPEFGDFDCTQHPYLRHEREFYSGRAISSVFLLRNCPFSGFVVKRYPLTAIDKNSIKTESGQTKTQGSSL